MTNPRSQEQSGSKERVGGWKKTVAVALLAAGALSACGKVEAQEPTPVKPTTPIESPSESPVESETPNATQEQMPKELEKYDAMEFDDFLAEPWETRMKYCSWYNRDIEDIAERFYSRTKNPKDKYPDTVGPNNTAQEKVTVSFYITLGAIANHRYGKKSDNDRVRLPEETAKKIMTCMQYESGKVGPGLAENLETLQRAIDAGRFGGNPEGLALNTSLEPVEVISYRDPEALEGGVISQYVESVSNDGVMYNGNVYSREYIDYAGNPQWIHE